MTGGVGWDRRRPPAAAEDAAQMAERATLAAPRMEEIERAKGPGGGWTKDQLAEWGVPWPPPKGWKERLTEAAVRDPMHKAAADLQQRGRAILAALEENREDMAPVGESMPYRPAVAWDDVVAAVRRFFGGA